MFETHKHVRLDLPDATTIWRYTSLSKLIALLANRSLFFARIDRLNDAFEGTLSRANTEMAFLGGFSVSGERFHELRTNIQASNRASMFVNCWHANPYESAAMWQLYSLAGEGIAIRSSIGSLKRSFRESPQTIYIGDVKYIDYAKEPIPLQNALQAVLRKRKSFEHEREVRCVSTYFAPNTNILTDNSQPTGLIVPVDLDVLIDSVYVAPGQPPWFASAVRAVCRKFDCPHDPIEGMADRPLA